MELRSSVIAANLGLLDQGTELIAALPDDAYGSLAADAKPVGPHFRHVFEHYSCFLDGLDAARIDYDGRQREQAIETERRAALARIAELRAGLIALDGAELDRAVDARLESGLGEDAEQWSRTTLRRELHFLLSHTVHHYALIALILAKRGIEVGAEFGVAPSTLKYWQSRPTCAPPAG